MKKWLVTLWLLVVMPLTAAAQQIPVKTIPVATGNQFMIFPSQNMSMGGVSIALDDPLYDAFVNPAKGINIQGVRFASSPAYYGVSMRDDFLDDASSTRTLPVGMLLRQGTLFGGAVMAWQEMSKETGDGCCFFAEQAFTENTVSHEQSSTTRNNVYAFAMGGAQLPGTNLSVGLSVFAASLDGLEGVRLLYSDGDLFEQNGTMSSFRLGFYNQWDDGRSAELTVQHHRFQMDHERTWGLPREGGPPILVTRLEQDETNGWAVLAGFQQPLAGGWRLGVRLVGDWKNHPKIPNYDLMQIPRDPGNTSAYNIGVGLSRTIGQTTYGFDLIYEPIWSHTWADAAEDTPIGGFAQPEDNVIRAGEMTVENFFEFDNSIFRLGVRQAGDRFDFGLGLGLHLYRYHLDQEDFVRQFKRKLDESWGEWTLSLGMGYNFTGFQLRYLSLITLGTGRPGIDGGPRFARDQAFAESSFVVAPAGPLALQDARVWTHQLSLLIPIVD